MTVRGLVLLALFLAPAIARERLDRGVVAVRASAEEVFIGWRLLADDPAGVAFNVYRFTGTGPAVLLTPSPLTGPTHFIDRSADLTQDNWFIVHSVVNGRERDENPFAFLQANSPVRQYLSILLDPPLSGVTPDNVEYSYSPNDASVGDLDGDGQYEIVLKWDPSNSKDNSQSGHTGNVYLDAYTLYGARLWRIDLGRNIRAGAHYTQFLVYDFDGDGRAEVVCKTAPGTLDASGRAVATTAELFDGAMPATDPAADYRNANGYVLTGPEFFTIFDGLTGAELKTAFYDPPRNNDPTSANVNAWGDNYGNRVDRFLAAVAYLDGEWPSFVLARGYYTRAVLAAWNWRGGKLSRVWTFDSEAEGNAGYRGEGNHNLSVADVDGDGRDEIVYGAAAIDDDGRGLYASGRGHGDALHVADMDPSRPGLEVFQPHETPARYGYHALDYRDARTGVPICGVEATGDIGRGVAFDIDPRYPGSEFWGAGSTGGLYNVATCAPDPVKGARATAISARKPSTMNFGVWWDGDPLREMLDNVTISKWDWEAATLRTLLTSTEIASNNGTKATPVLSADILGDWREEVIWRRADNLELRVYTTTIPTSLLLPTLMHDRQYRLAIAWQNVSYNQPPHPSSDPGAIRSAER